MSDEKRMGIAGTLLVTLVAFTVVVAAFYGLDLLVMSIQGLPLNMDLSPAG